MADSGRAGRRGGVDLTEERRECRPWRQRALSVAAPAALLLLLGACLAGCGGDGGDASSDPLVPDGPCEALWEVQLRVGTRLEGATDATFGFADYTLFADGRVVGPDGGACVTAITQRLEDLCEPCRSDPGSCEAGVRRVFSQVPPECSACGDGTCLLGEDETNCAQDCRAQCGDGFCVPPETASSCPADCQLACGDGVCAQGESPETCPQDCNFTVGDGTCSPGEGPQNSPVDCRQLSCGDGWCQSYETSLQCPQDCCLPMLCQPGVQRCTGSHELGECVVDGPQNCPGFAVVESCALGCLPAGTDPDAHCRTCAELVRETLGDAATPCDPQLTGPYCSGANAVTCQPLPGFPDCGTVFSAVCPSGHCLDGQCVTCESCTLGALRCGATGGPERCAAVTGECLAWSAWGNNCAESGLSCVEGTGEARCCAPEPCSAPGTASCGDGLTRVACVDDGLCGGYEVVEPCEGGWVCDVDPDDATRACAPCCVPGEARCAADGATVQRCLTHPSVAACGQWAVETACGAGEACADDGSGPACTAPP